MKPTRLCLLLAIISLLGLISTIDTVGQQAETINEKASKYHQILKKRPGGGYLFDRFYNAWLDTGSLEGLQTYLTEESKKADSTTGDALILGFFHARQGEDSLALTVFTEALKKDPENAAAWLEKAKLSTRALDFETALTDLDQVLAKSKKKDLTMEASKMKGRLLLRTGDNQAAIKLWSSLLKENSDDEDLHEDLIENQIDEGLFEEAIKTSKLLVTKTKDPYLKVLRQLRTGDIYQRLSQRDNALKAYQDSLSSTGAGSWIEKEILSQIEQVFRKEDDITGLSEFLATLSKTETQRPAVIRKQAEVLMEQSETDAAIKLFDQLLARTPGERPLREAYIDLLSKAERYDKAVSQTETLIAQNKQDAELLIRLASLQNKAEQNDKINETLNRYLKQTQDAEFATLRVARLQESFDKDEAAEKTYRQYLKEHSDNTNALETFAAFLHRIDKKTEAIDIWKGLAKDGNRDQVVRMARSLVSRQEFEAAFSVLQERYDDFQSDIVYLGQLCTVAIRLEKYNEAVEWAHRRVRLVESAVDMEQAIQDAARIVSKSDQADEFIESLSNQEKLSDQDACLLAELIEKEGDFDRSNALLKGRDSELVLSQKIRLLKFREDWQGAAKATRSLIANSGGRKSNFLRDLVGLYRRSGDIDQARKTIPEWKTVSPGSIDPWLIEASLAEEAGEEDETIAILRSASRKFPDDTAVLSRLASTYQYAGKFADAKRIYLNLYEESKELSDKIRWIGELASISRDEGKTDQLIEQFEERKRNNRQSIAPLLALSEIYRASDEYEERRKALLEASRLKPRDVNFMLEIARIEESEGNWEDAIKTLERARSIDNSPRIIERIASLQIASGDEDKGYRLIDELAGKLSSDPNSILKFADAMASRQEWERVIEFLTPRVEQNADDYRFHYVLGIAREELGENEAAIESFTRILSIDTEITSLKKTLAKKNSHVSSYLKNMPPSFKKFYNFTNSSRGAYTYRNRNQSGYYRRGRIAQNSQTLAKPASLETAHVYALTHLQTIITFLEESETEKLTERLKNTLSDDQSIFLEIRFNPTRHSFDITEEVLDKYPNDIGLQYYWLTYQGRNNTDSERLLKIYDSLEKEYPHLALQIAMMVARTNQESGKTLIEKSFKYVETLNEPDETNLQILAAIMQAKTSNQLKLTEPQLKLVRDKLLDLYPKAKGINSQYSPWLFWNVCSALSEGDSKTYIDFLQSKIKENSKPRAGQNLSSFYGGRSNTFLVPMVFPPQKLHQFPAEVLNLMQNQNQGYYNRGSQPPTPEKLEEWYQAASEPILKLLLAARIDNQSKRVGEEIEKLLKSKTANPIAAAQLAAGYYANLGEFSKAVAALESVRYQPMSRALRKDLDLALLHSAMQLDTDAEGDKKAVEAGKAAALRVSYLRLSQQNRGELINAMSTLGMDAAAEKQEQKLINSAASSINRQSPTTRVNQSRIKQLVDSGKKETAVKELTLQVKTMGLQLVNSNNHNQSYYVRQLTQEIERHGLTDDILAVIEKNKGQNNQKLIEYAGACIVLNETKKAIETLKTVVEKDPRKAAPKILLASLLMVNDPDQAGPIVDSLDATSAAQAATMVIQEIESRNRPTTVEGYYKPIKGCFRLLNKIDERSAANWHWPSKLVSLMTKQWYNISSINSINLYNRDITKAKPVVDPKASASTQTKQKRTLEVWNERWQLHDKMVAELWKVPELSALAYECEQAGAHVRGNEFEATKKAKEAILAMADLRSFPASHRQFHQYNLPSPSEALVIDAFKTKNREQIEKDLFKQLEGKRNKKAITRYLSDLLAVYFADTNEITKEFEKRMPSSHDFLIGHSNNVSHVFTRLVRNREMEPTTLSTYLLSAAKKTNGHYPNSNNSAVVIEMGKQSPEVLEKFLNDYCEHCCGKPGKRTQQQKNTQRQFSSYLNNLAIEPKIFPVLLRVYQSQELSGEYCYTFTNSDTYRSSEKFFQFFGKSSMLTKQAKDFRILSNFNRNRRGSGFESLIYGVTRYSNSTSKKEIIAKLKTLNGFGPMLLSKIAEGKHQEAYDLIKKNHAALNSMPEDEQFNFSAMIKRQILSKLKKTPDDDLYSWIKERSSVTSNKLLTEFLKAKRLQDLKDINSIYELRQKGLPLMVQFEKSDPEKSKQVFHQMVKLGYQESRINQHSGYNWQTDEQWLSSYTHQNDSNIDRIGVLLDIITSEEPFHLSHAGTDGSYGIGDCLIKLFSGKNKAEVRQSLDSIFPKLHKMVGDNESKQLLLALEFRTVIYRLSSSYRPTYVEWVNKNATGKPHSDLAQALGMAMRLSLANQSDRSKKYKNLKKPDSYLPYFENIIAEESTVPRRLKIALAEYLFNYSRGVISTKTIKQSTKLLIESLSDNDETPFQSTAASILYEFSRIPIDEEWKTIAAELPAAWKKQTRFQHNSSNYLYYQPTDNLYASMHNILCQLKDEAALNSFSTRNRTKLNNSGTLINLLRNGHQDLALSLVKRNKSGLPYQYYGNASYHTDLESLGPEFLKKIEDPKIRYLAKLSIAQAPDERPAIRQKIDKTIRNKRIVEVAEGLKASGLEGSMRQSALAIFSKVPEAMPHIKFAMQEAFDSFNFERARKIQDYSTIRTTLKVPTDYAIAELNNGNHEPAHKMWMELTKPGSSSYRFYALRDILQKTNPIEHLSKGKKDVAAGFLKYYQTIASNYHTEVDNYQFPEKYIGLSIILGEDAEFINKIPKDDADLIKDSIGNFKYNITSNLNKCKDHFTDEEKLAMIDRLFSHPWSMKELEKANDALYRLYYGKFLPFNKFEPKFDELIKAHPRKGLAASDVASIYAKRKQYKKAAKYYQQSAAFDDVDKKRIARANHYAAKNLHLDGQRELAKKTHASVDVTHLSKTLKASHAKLLKSINLPPKKKTSGKGKAKANK